MPSRFPITKVISNGNRPGEQQIVTTFQGKSVTRHTRNGIGFHPDDSIPGVHKRIIDRIQDATRMVADKKQAIGLLEQKKPKGWEELVIRMQAEILTLDNTVEIARAAQIHLQKEDPIMVTFG